MSSQLADDLRAARALIDTPEKWLKGAWHGKGKTCFCALGAVEYVGDGALTARSNAMRAALRAVCPGTRVTSFNDHPDTTHADVMALFDRAIAQSEVE